MIKMVEFDEGVWVPEECCTMTNPATSEGESVPDDVEMPCEGSESCTGDCDNCIIQIIMNEYALCTGQATDQAKKKKFSIRVDITMDKEMSYEVAERTIMNALRQAGMVGHCGGINQNLVEVEKMKLMITDTNGNKIFKMIRCIIV